MDQLKHTYCLHNMVCDNPSSGGVEIVHMPEFFTEKQELETGNHHVHHFYEIIWFQEGTGKHYVDFKEYPVSPNTVFFIAPGQVHSFDGNPNQQGYVMKICSGLLNDSSSVDGILLKYNVFNVYDSVPYIKIEPKDYDELIRIIHSIEREMHEPYGIGHKDYLQSLVKMLIIQFERSHEINSEQLFSPNKVSHKVFLTFRRELDRNFRTLHTVKDYASLLNVSTKTLANYVAECSTYTPLEMINNRITIEAKRLLRYSDHMIKEVAFELGFNDPSYFVKFFKRQAGCSPADYRTPE